MNIHVENKLENLKVLTTQEGNGDIHIIIQADERRKLGSVKCGETVKSGNREFIVLGHGTDTTAVIAKDSVKSMACDGNGDYRKSSARKYLNDEFYKEMVAAVGAENIIQHTVDLTADDGTGKGITCQDNISLITTNNYRRYREYLPKRGESWWTATRATYDESTGYTRNVCFVRSRGILVWGGCDYGRGVCPFCILNSSILVS